MMAVLSLPVGAVPLLRFDEEFVSFTVSFVSFDGIFVSFKEAFTVFNEAFDEAFVSFDMFMPLFQNKQGAHSLCEVLREDSQGNLVFSSLLFPREATQQQSLAASDLSKNFENNTM